MTRHSPDLDHHRLLQLSDEVGRISATLAQLSMGLEEPAEDSGHPSEQVREISEETVRWIINARKLRSRFLPASLFADPAWDMLLESLRAEIAQRRISVSSLCFAANAPTTTALRYIKTMVQQGLMMREPDHLMADECTSDWRPPLAEHSGIIAPACSSSLSRCSVGGARLCGEPSARLAACAPTRP